MNHDGDLGVTGVKGQRYWNYGSLMKRVALLKKVKDISDNSKCSLTLTVTLENNKASYSVSVAGMHARAEKLHPFQLFETIPHATWPISFSFYSSKALYVGPALNGCREVHTSSSEQTAVDQFSKTMAIIHCVWATFVGRWTMLSPTFLWS